MIRQIIFGGKVCNQAEKKRSKKHKAQDSNPDNTNQDQRRVLNTSPASAAKLKQINQFLTDHNNIKNNNKIHINGHHQQSSSSKRSSRDKDSRRGSNGAISHSGHHSVNGYNQHPVNGHSTHEESKSKGMAGSAIIDESHE